MQAADLEIGSDTMKMFQAVAKAFKGKMVFVTVNNEGESAEPVGNFFGLKEVTGPAVSVQLEEKQKPMFRWVYAKFVGVVRTLWL